MRGIYERSEMELKEVVLENFDELMRDYVFPYFKEIPDERSNFGMSLFGASFRLN